MSETKEKKKFGCTKIVLIIIGIFVVIGIIASLAGGGKDTPTDATTQTETNVVDTTENTTDAEAEGTEEAQEQQLTTGQQNALRKADDYLSTMSFSHSGLVEQLEYEGFSTEDAIFAADNCGADWNEQAAKKAQDYLDTMSFSRDGLVEQLEYEGFTAEQAEYGATAVGY